MGGKHTHRQKSATTSARTAIPSAAVSHMLKNTLGSKYGVWLGDDIPCLPVPQTTIYGCLHTQLLQTAVRSCLTACYLQASQKGRPAKFVATFPTSPCWFSVPFSAQISHAQRDGYHPEPGRNDEAVEAWPRLATPTTATASCTVRR